MGGGRAIFGVLLGVAIVAAGVFAGSRWLPKPEKKIEWVHSPESIIVQMKRVPAGSDPRWHTPSFTLYGDGTLIFEKDPARPIPSLRRALISDKQLRDLLNFMDSQGFFDFPAMFSQDGGDTTFVYAAEKQRQNASGARPIETPMNSSKEAPRALTNLQSIKAQIEELALNADVGATDYSPESIIIYIFQKTAQNGTGPAFTIRWPFPNIDPALLAPEFGKVGDLRVEGPEARDVAHDLDTYGLTLAKGGAFLKGDVRYGAVYRPVLPYEDNFPEFEPPTQ